jgi:hypothetical protein
LLAEPSGRNDAPRRKRYGRAEYRLGHEDVLGVMPHRARWLKSAMIFLDSSNQSWTPHFFTLDNE